MPTVVKKDDLVGKKVMLKAGAMWEDDLTGIKLKNFPASTRWEKSGHGTKEVEVPATAPEDRVATIPDGKDLTKVKIAILNRTLEILEEEKQLDDPMPPKPDTLPRSKDEAKEQNKDYYVADDGTVIHKRSGDSAYDVLQNPAGKVVSMVPSIVDLGILSSMLSLEKGGHNLAKQPRPMVVEAIEKRLKEKDVSGFAITKESEQTVLTTEAKPR